MLLYLQGLGDTAPFNSIEEWEALTGEEFRRGGGVRRAEERREAEGRAGDEESRRAQGGGRGAGEPTGLPEGGDSFRAWRTEIQALFTTVMEEHRLDGLFFPQAGSPVPDLIEDPDRPDYNPNNHPELPSNIVNDIGLPVVTLPFAYYDDGTPFVLAFIGDLWTEAELLSYAYDLEKATLARVPPVLREKKGG
jgi:Asp-tRNA(Asn)/Glu-tRNA(Gln) amidotransferase A subunit family amidase